MTSFFITQGTFKFQLKYSDHQLENQPEELKIGA